MKSTLKRFLITSALGLATTFSATSSAETGLSYLGLCSASWSCQDSLSAFDSAAVIRTGWLMNTFAPDCRCAEQLLALSKPKEIRIHIANGPCLRNQRCGKYEIFSGYTLAAANAAVLNNNSRLMRRFRNVLRQTKALISNSRGELTLYISPCLECDLSESQRRILRRTALRFIPASTVVDSVVQRPCLNGSVCEKHGRRPGLRAPCISDLDGEIGAAPAAIESFLSDTKQCDLSYVWDLGMNCNREGAAFIDPRKRNCFHSKSYFGRWKEYLS